MSRRHAKRASASHVSVTSSINYALTAAEMDGMFEQSDEEEENIDALNQQFLLTLEDDQNSSNTPIPNDDNELSSSISTVNANDITHNKHQHNRTETFQINDDDIFDIVAEVDKADNEYQQDNDDQTDTNHNNNYQKTEYTNEYKLEKNEEKLLQTDEQTTYVTTLQTVKKKYRSHEKELIGDIIERLKIAVTFLLHKNSPLYLNNKHNNNACFQEYNVDESDENTDFELYHAKVNLLYNEIYKNKHDLIYKQWCKWLQYADRIENGEIIDIQEKMNESHEFIEHEEHILEDISDDFILNKATLKKTTQSIIGSFASKTLKTERDHFTRMATHRQQKRKLENKKIEHKEEKDNDFIQKRDTHLSQLEINTSEDMLYIIEDRQSMKQWIKKYKHDLMSQAFNCCHREYTEDAGQTDFDITTPMNTWSWQNVVAFIEASEALRHLASVFWQYRITGAELCRMGSKQIELLIECSMLNNHNFVETEFDKLKNISADKWELCIDAKKFVYYKDQMRIQSHIISKYHLAIDVLHDIIYGVIEDDKHQHKEFYEDSAVIFDVISFLRANNIDGSKEYWKIDAYFFNKIDNYLAVLISDDLIREMYQKCYLYFLISPDK
eukprot:418343_1